MPRSPIKATDGSGTEMLYHPLPAETDWDEEVISVLLSNAKLNVFASKAPVASVVMVAIVSEKLYQSFFSVVVLDEHSKLRAGIDMVAVIARQFVFVRDRRNAPGGTTGRSILRLRGVGGRDSSGGRIIDREQIAGADAVAGSEIHEVARCISSECCSVELDNGSGRPHEACGL